MPEKSEAKLEESGFYIDFGAEKKPRKRKVITRSNARPTWKYPSRKEKEIIYCESVLELDACRIFDVDHIKRCMQNKRTDTQRSAVCQKK